MEEKKGTQKNQSEEQPQEAGEVTKQGKPQSAKPVRTLTIGVLLLCLILFMLYVSSDRLTPYTDQARIKGLAMPIVSNVSGNVTDIKVRLHTAVTVGDTIFQVDIRPFDLAIRNSEARLENTQQQVGAKTATVQSATGRLGVAKAQLDRAQRNYDRVMNVLAENPGALSLADRDAAETALMQAVEQVASSEADLEKAEQQLGVSGPENPQVRSAVVALEQAHLNRAYSTILAPADGIIESYNVDIGYYASPGQPLAMLITSTDLWIEADLKENNLSNMKEGDEVEYILDVAPGKIFKGKVRSLGYGVNSGTSDRGKLPDVKGTSGWLRDPQRFPVIISMDYQEVISYTRLGGQADVVVYTGTHPLLNLFGRLRLRLNGLLSYLR